MSDPTDIFYRIAADAVRPMQDAFLNGIRETLATCTERSITDALKKSGFVIEKALSSVDEIADILGANISRGLVERMTDAWLASGRKVSSVLPKSALTQPFQFDTARLSALLSNDGHRAALVRNITEEQRLVISRCINRGFVLGKSRAQVARDIRAVIGLTEKQMDWVDNYRNQLLALDPKMFDRILRDRRSDRLLNRLIEEGGALTQAQVDRLVERYRQRLIQYRARTIARTEALRAVRTGEYDALISAQEQGSLSPLLRRFWVTCMDEKVRRTHTQIPGMNFMGRGVDEPFQTPLGLLRFPCDPLGAAANVINCRCHLEYRMPNSNGVYVGRSSFRLDPNLASVLGGVTD